MVIDLDWKTNGAVALEACYALQVLLQTQSNLLGVA